jgi:general L-amino acid transport system substrate-binding protein
MCCAYALFIVLVAGLSAAPAAAAKAKLCAFRSGPNGPCSCKTSRDGPGEFTIVSKRFCRRAESTAAQPAESDIITGTNPPSAEQPKAEAPKPAAETPKAEAPRPEAEAPQAAAEAPAAQPGKSDIETGANPPPSAEKPKDEALKPAAGRSPAQADPNTETPAADAKPSTQVAVTHPATIPTSSNQKLKDVRARGKLLCGVSTGLLGFSAQTDSGEWRGLDADFCRAIATVVLGDPSKVEFRPLESEARFEALKSGEIDLLSRNTTWTMDREVIHGVEFVGIIYFDGQSFMTSEDRGLVSAQQLAGGTICVEKATTTEKNVAFYLKTHQIDAEIRKFDVRKEMLKAYLDRTCDAIASDRSALFSERAGFPEPLKHIVLPEVISKDPLGPAVQHGDIAWEEIVRWTLAGLINAEEVGLDKASALSAQPLRDDAQRLVESAGATGVKLQLARNWLRDAVAAVGNYGEMFDTNVGKASPLGMNRGLNSLWKKGGILYAPPMW